MTLASGSRFGSFEVVAPLGAGGMGEVYRARDTKIGREVALKLLPESFAHDPERLARFKREAQILGALNHPHIAAIYGVEDVDSTPVLVLELVEGETLDARLKARATPENAARGFSRAFTIDEALAIASQIADALQAAHDKGIVHRDLKPANIAITHDGQVKVLDFGLARHAGDSWESSGSGGLTQSPTITFAHTQAGVILGTAAYMSPEQARGRVADKRADIWAFGCVLYELLAGKRAFDGDDATDVIAAIVRGEPDWSALPVDLPEPIRLLVKRCLEKDRNARISDIGVARFLMSERIGAPATPIPQVPLPSHRSRVVGWTAAFVLGVLLALAGAWAVAAFRPEPRATPIRFALTPTGNQTFVMQGADRNVDIAPDGSYVVYRGASQIQPQLFLRRIDELDARPVIGAPDFRSPFVSFDGRWIGYFSGPELKKVLASGGPPVTICRISGAPRGATWLPDDSIVFSVADRGGLRRVPAGGGEPKVLARSQNPDVESYTYPSALPNGRGVLFTIITSGRISTAQIAVVDPANGKLKTLIGGGNHAQYVGGYLVYASGDALRAVRFDQDSLTVKSDPVPVLEQVLNLTGGAANYGVSRNGSLVYVPASAGVSVVTQRTLVWVDRKGHEEPIAAPPRPYGIARISPDGTRLALDVRDQQSDIWTWDLTRQTLTRLTFDPTVDQLPVWTPDSRSIVWSSQRVGGTPTLHRQSADGIGVAEPLAPSLNPQFPTSIHPDGKRIVLWENSGNTSQDIGLLDLSTGEAGKRRAQPLIHTPAIEVGGEISPDGHWLAYQSTESGQAEIYARPFPNVEGGRWQVSTAGGTRPAWSPQGREMFYLDTNGFLTAVPVRVTATTFSAGSPTKVLNTKYYPGATGLGLDARGYDVSRDGQRFLMLKELAPPPSATGSPTPNMIVIVNWLEELKTRLSR